MRKFYQVGGSLPAVSPSYVNRQADEDFYNYLNAGEFCYALTCRQMGKSSLQIRTQKRLEEQGKVCCVIDLSSLGEEDVTPDQWYAGFVSKLAYRFLKDFRFSEWWRERSEFSSIRRVDLFVEEVLLKECLQLIVIFLDEIDTIRSLKFRIDDFFALIRSWYNKRAQQSEFERLTFGLLGVATPTDLIADKSRTPFNIGKAIELTGFSLIEAQISLLPGLAEKIEQPEKVLGEIIFWTAGQPFLTQKLCYLLASNSPNKTTVNISEFVYIHIIENWESQDNPQHLRTIRNRLLRDEKRVGRILGLYQQILQQETIKADESNEQVELLLSGLIVKRGDKLSISNPIYQIIFNQKWVDRELRKLRPYGEAIVAWEASNHQDESRLLRGNALRDAQIWAEGKNLSNLDYQFLTASQKIETQEARRNLATAKKANKILNDANKKAKKIIFLGSAICLIALAVIIFYYWQQDLNLISKDLISDSREALLNFQEKSQLDALIGQMEAGRKGQKLLGIINNDRLAEQLRLTQEEILDNIHEQNILFHKEEVKSISFSPVDPLLATASNDGYVRLWDWQGKLKKSFKASKNALNYIVFSSNGKQLVTAAVDGSIKLWNLEGKLLKEFLDPSQDKEVYEVYNVSFSPDEKLIAIASSKDRKVWLWDLQNDQKQDFQIPKTSKTSKTFLASKSVKSISFNPQKSCQVDQNETLFATAQDTGTVIVWNLQGEEKYQKEFFSSVNDLSFGCSSEEHLQLAIAISNNAAILWDLQENQVKKFSGHKGAVNSVNFSSDGQWLVTTSSDKTIRLWDREGNQLKKLTGHLDAVNDASFSLDNQKLLLASASRDGNVKLWNLQDNPLEESFTSFVFSPNGQQLAAISSEGELYWWNLSGGNLFSQKKLLYPSDLTLIFPNMKKSFLSLEKPINVLNLSQDGQQLVTTTNDNKLQLWNFKDLKKTELIGHQRSIWSVSFSSDGRYLATASSDGTVRLWKKGNFFRTIRLSEKPLTVYSVKFSPKGDYLATASDDGAKVSDGGIARLWNLEGEEKQYFSHKEAVYDVNFSPDGKQLATASKDGYVRLWNLKDGKLLQQLPPPEMAQFQSSEPEEVICPQYPTNLRNSAKVSQNRKETTKSPICPAIIKIEFSQNGKQLATVSRDREYVIQLWNLEEKNPQKKLQGEFKQYQGRINNILFSPDGQYLAIASTDGSIKFWDVQASQLERLEQALKQGCDWLKDSLDTQNRNLEDLECTENP